MTKENGDYEAYMDLFSKLNVAFRRMVLPHEMVNVAFFIASDESLAISGSAYVDDAIIPLSENLL